MNGRYALSYSDSCLY